MDNIACEFDATTRLPWCQIMQRLPIADFRQAGHDRSGRVENHMHAIALHFMHYNFVRIHKCLRCTPATEAGVAKKFWSIEDIVALIYQRGS